MVFRHPSAVGGQHLYQPVEENPTGCTRWTLQTGRQIRHRPVSGKDETPLVRRTPLPNDLGKGRIMASCQERLGAGSLLRPMAPDSEHICFVLFALCRDLSDFEVVNQLYCDPVFNGPWGASQLIEEAAEVFPGVAMPSQSDLQECVRRLSYRTDPEAVEGGQSLVPPAINHKPVFSERGVEIHQLGSDHRHCLAKRVKWIPIRHALKGYGNQDVRVEEPCCVSELSRADRIRTLVGCYEASRESPERHGLEKLVIFVLVRPEKTHEAPSQVVNGELDRERNSGPSGEIHHRGIGLRRVKPRLTGDTRDPAVGESLEEGYADSIEPSGQGLSVDLAREVPCKTSVDQIRLRVDLSSQTTMLSWTQPEV